MTDTSPLGTDESTAPTDDRSRAPESTMSLTAVIVENDLGPAECTLYPRGASKEDLVTNWISAEEDSYVSLEEMR